MKKDMSNQVSGVGCQAPGIRCQVSGARWRRIVVALIFIAGFLLSPKDVFAQTCATSISGDFTVSTACAIPASTVDGVDAGTGTTNTANVTLNGAMTLNASSTFAWGGSITIGAGGSIAMSASGAQLRQVALWMTDADLDNYPASTTQIAQSTAPVNGRRRNLMATKTATDCLETDVDVYQNVGSLASDDDQDGYSDTVAATQCVGTSAVFQSRTYYANTAAAFVWLTDSQKLGTSDCNDASSTTWQNLSCFADSDADTVAVSTASTLCSGASCPSGYLGTAGTDCNDASAIVQANRTQYTDADGDGYDGGSTAGVCSSSSTWGNSACTTAGSSYAKNSAGTCILISTLGTDCFDSNACGFRNVSVAQDGDNDAFTSTTTTSTQCVGSTSGCAAGYYQSGVDCTCIWRDTASASTDCNDGNANIQTNRLYYIDADGDTFTLAGGTQCLSNSTWGNSACTTAGSSYAKDASASCVLLSALSGATDCNDASATTWQNLTCFTDSDNDTYTVGVAGTVCKGSACNSPVGHLAAASATADCYDANANARPNQLSFFTTNRGDGSFDYNCSGTITATDTRVRSGATTCTTVPLTCTSATTAVSLPGACGTTDCFNACSVSCAVKASGCSSSAAWTTLGCQ